MKKIAIIVVSAIFGIVLISVLNNTEISSFGYGAELAIGWQEPVPQEDVFCDLQARYDEGLPFSTQRPAQTCLTAHNSLANFINLAIGAMFGASIASAISEMKHKK